jgi:hypothetical protein
VNVVFLTNPYFGAAYAAFGYSKGFSSSGFFRAPFFWMMGDCSVDNSTRYFNASRAATIVTLVPFRVGFVIEGD